MPPRKIHLGAGGQHARDALGTIRRARELTLAELSRRLDQLGHPISVSSLSQLENGGRRMDADDIVALAAALDVQARLFVERGERGADRIPERIQLAELREVTKDLLDRIGALESERADRAPIDLSGMTEVSPDELLEDDDDGDR